MTDSKPRSRPQWLVAVSAGITIWSGLIWAAATIPGRLPEFDIPSLCGPWGCTAETNDLVAYHLVWLAITLPIAAWFALRSQHAKRFGRWLAGGSLAAIVGTIVVASIYWRVQFGQPTDPWPWRYGLFLLFRNADLPVIPALLSGLTLMLAHQTAGDSACDASGADTTNASVSP